jgi:hypothetical protein
MTEIAPWRLNLLRAGYLLIIVGLGLVLWPSILDPAKSWPPDRGVVVAMLASLSLLSLVGLIHPLRMLPLLFWEITWKAIWLIRIALPLWMGDRLDASTIETIFECLVAILIVAVIPWDFVQRVYITAPGDRWRPSARRGRLSDGAARAPLA